MTTVSSVAPVAAPAGGAGGVGGGAAGLIAAYLQRLATVRDAVRGNPPAVQRAAQHLQSAAAHLEALCGRVGQEAGAVRGSWRGEASAMFGERVDRLTQELQRDPALVRAGAAALLQVAPRFDQARAAVEAVAASFRSAAQQAVARAQAYAATPPPGGLPAAFAAQYQARVVAYANAWLTQVITQLGEQATKQAHGVQSRLEGELSATAATLQSSRPTSSLSGLTGRISAGTAPAAGSGAAAGTATTAGAGAAAGGGGASEPLHIGDADVSFLQGSFSGASSGKLANGKLVSPGSASVLAPRTTAARASEFKQDAKLQLVKIDEKNYGSVLGIPMSQDITVGVGNVGIGAGTSTDHTKGTTDLSVGASASALDARSSVLYGDKNFGVTSSAGTTVGGASAGASFTREGFKASIGVAPNTVSASEGVNIGGINIGVNGSLSDGVSAGVAVGPGKAEVTLGPASLGVTVGPAVDPTGAYADQKGFITEPLQKYVAQPLDDATVAIIHKALQATGQAGPDPTGMEAVERKLHPPAPLPPPPDDGRPIRPGAPVRPVP